MYALHSHGVVTDSYGGVRVGVAIGGWKVFCFLGVFETSMSNETYVL